MPIEKRISGGLLAIRTEICERLGADGSRNSDFQMSEVPAWPGPQPLMINAENRCLDVRLIGIPDATNAKIGGATGLPLLVKNVGRWLFWGLAAVALFLSAAMVAGFWGESHARMRSRAEAAARDGDWPAALKRWRAINATRDANGLTHLGEARACLALGRAMQAERSLRKSIEADPRDPAPWRLLLEVFQVEGRTLEALRAGWQAYDNVGPESRRLLLRELTFSLLADLPDESVRVALRRWIDADGDDVDARIALLQRVTVQPRATDPERAALLADLESIVASQPNHITARRDPGDRPRRRR